MPQNPTSAQTTSHRGPFQALCAPGTSRLKSGARGGDTAQTWGELSRSPPKALSSWGPPALVLQTLRGHLASNERESLSAGLSSNLVAVCKHLETSQEHGRMASPSGTQVREGVAWPLPPVFSGSFPSSALVASHPLCALRGCCTPCAWLGSEAGARVEPGPGESAWPLQVYGAFLALSLPARPLDTHASRQRAAAQRRSA